MNSNWQNKIRQLEVPAPASAWDNIANTLNDADGDTRYDFAVKLADYSTAPPAGGEENIFAMLDEEKKESFEKKIFNYSEAVPNNAWKNIVAILDKKQAKIIPFTRKNLLRAAAAVAVIIIASVVAVRFSKSGKNSEDIAASKPAVSPATSSPLPDNPQEGIIQKNEIAEQKTSSSISEKSQQTSLPLVARRSAVPAYIQSPDEAQFLPNPANGKKEKLQNSKGDTPEDIALLSAPSYVTVTGPDGLPIKVSNKFSSLIAYLMDKNPATQENIDIIIKESAKWKATFASWRDKMTNNNIAPSLSNFMDIIELSEVLEDKK